MLRRTILLLTALALLVIPSTAAAKPAPRGPALAAPESSLNQALECTDLAGATRDPVLLVHGTFADSAINWSWNYVEALPAVGIPACTVDLPDRSAGDIQASTEYVVHAIRSIAQQSGRKVALVGLSQGGLEMRWALRWWPDLARLVSDVIMLNTPNQGSIFSDAICQAPGVCAASLYQMKSDSAFVAALNQGRDTIKNVPYTSIVTADDQTFVLASQGVLGDGKRKLVSNIVVQDVCPGHQVDHVGEAYDGPTYAIVLEALDNRGPADPRRVDRAVCQTDTMPFVTRDEANAKLFEYAGTLAQLLGPDGPKAPGEPPLACYVTHSC